MLQTTLTLDKPPVPRKGITVGSLFAGGVDGGILGFQMASPVYAPVVSLDFDPSATKVLQHNHSHTVLTRDIREESWRTFEDCMVQIITAPCQTYSPAQSMNQSKMDQKKLVEGKELYLHGFRQLAMGQPEVFVAENVPKFLNYRIPTECFTELRPYTVFIFQLDTADFRLPQERARVFFLGFRQPWPYSEVPDPLQYQIHDRQLYIRDIKEPDPEINIPDYIKKRVDGGYRDLPSIKTDNDLGNTCVAHYGKDQGTELIMDERGYKGLRPYTVREYARKQGIPDWYDFSPATRTTAYKLIGNSVSPLPMRALGLITLEYFRYYYPNLINEE
jgi:DNA (cytosine-5)-methyltransferase 1